MAQSRPKAMVDKDIKAEHEQKVKSERDRINAERAKINKQYDIDRAACYKKFAVSGCIEDLQVKRREVLDDLKRQEILINDEERRRKAAERLNSIEEKQSEELRQERELKAEKAHADRLEKAEKKAEKKAGGNLPREAGAERQLPSRSGPTPEQAKANEEALRRKQERHAQEMQTRAERAANAAKNEQEYAQKQQEAADHRERTLQRDAERVKTGKGSKAKPLPDPPS
jgi:hypothetical protein